MKIFAYYKTIDCTIKKLLLPLKEVPWGKNRMMYKISETHLPFV